MLDLRHQTQEFEAQFVNRTTNLSPHLPDIFKNHVAVPIKGPHST